MATINASVGGIELNNTINGITINASISQTTISVSIAEIAQVTASYIEEDARFRFNGSGGDTYLSYNSTSGKLELWVSGIKKQQW